MNTVTLTVPGIHCGHCKAAIEGALGQLEGVAEADVEIDAKTVTVTFDESRVGLDGIKDAIVEQGYDIPA